MTKRTIVLDEDDIDTNGGWVRRTLAAEDIAASLDEEDSSITYAYRVGIRYYHDNGDGLCEEISEETYNELLYSRVI